MIIKKYQAKTENDALNLAKEELGEGCVTMNVKTVKRKGIMKLFKAPYVEVTVALEENRDTEYESFKRPSVAASNDDRTILKKSSFDRVIDDEIKAESVSVTKKELVTDKVESGAVLKDNSSDSFTLEKDSVEKEKDSQVKEDSDIVLENGIDAVYELISQTLIENEVDEDYVEEIIEDAKNRLKSNTPMDTVLSHIYQRLILRFGEPKTIVPSNNGPMVVFFVGTTGVGKTTTIAKIASKLYVAGNKVALFTSDTYRIAAAEQLRSYANIMSVPFRIIYTIDDFEEGLEQFKDYDYILVDTVGHSHKNQELKNDMKAFIDFSKDKAETEVYLVLAASTKMKDLIHIADSYKEITDYRLIFTKLDETYSYGTIFNIRMHTNAPLSYVTYGQNVPDDIDVFKPQTIVKKLLGGK